MGVTEGDIGQCDTQRLSKVSSRVLYPRSALVENIWLSFRVMNVQNEKFVLGDGR